MNNLKLDINMRELIKLVNGLSPSALIVLNYLIHQAARHDVIYSSQSRMAEVAGVTRETVNRHLKNLVGLGFISKQARRVKQTCLYKISSMFYNANVKEILSCFLSGLNSIGKFISSNLLSNNSNLNAVKNGIGVNVTQYNKRIISSNYIGAVLPHPSLLNLIKLPEKDILYTPPNTHAYTYARDVRVQAARSLGDVLRILIPGL